MKMKLLTFIALSLCSIHLSAQYEYEPSEKFPYGRLNPEAPKQTGDFGGVIGKHECLSVSRVNATTWADTVKMEWVFKYIMNGKGVQDETLKEDGIHSGSIRQFNADSSRWYVHYYSSKGASPKLGTWEGNLNEQGNIVLYKDQPAPNGMQGSYKLTFSNITKDGFNWLGEWVNVDETISYPTWKIFCECVDR